MVTHDEDEEEFVSRSDARHLNEDLDRENRADIRRLLVIALVAVLATALGFSLWRIATTSDAQKQQAQQQAQNANQNAYTLAQQVAAACQATKVEKEIADLCTRVEGIVDKGPSGPIGPQGPRGPEGPMGPQGPRGEDGTDGRNGKVGAAGSDGADGADGSDGATGSQGPVGPQGPAGADGTNGSDGADGADGSNGADAVPFTFTFSDNNTTYTCTVNADRTGTCTADQGGGTPQ